MDKINKFKLLMAVEENGIAVWKQRDVIGLGIDPVSGKITRVNCVDDKGNDVTIGIDNVTTFVQEFTGMFDKVGTALYGGDIVKLPVKLNESDPIEMVLPIVWVNGAWCLTVENAETPIYLDQANTLVMEKVGTLPENGEMVERAIDAVVKEQMESAGDAEIPL